MAALTATPADDQHLLRPPRRRRRGLAPGGLVTKDQYDGAGRLVDRRPRPTAPAARLGQRRRRSTGDHVLTETLTTYDADGNAILTTTKDRFDNDDRRTDTGALGNPTTGAQGPRHLRRQLLRRGEPADRHGRRRHQRRARPTPARAAVPRAPTPRW